LDIKFIVDSFISHINQSSKVFPLNPPIIKNSSSEILPIPHEYLPLHPNPFI